MNLWSAGIEGGDVIAGSLGVHFSFLKVSTPVYISFIIFIGILFIKSVKRGLHF